jgi:sortase A
MTITTAPDPAPAPPDPAPPRPGRRRRAVRALSSVLIVAGLLLLADAIVTVVWQEPLTALQASRAQHGLSGDLDRLTTRDVPSAGETRALERLAGQRRRVAFLARRLARRTTPGQAVARIRLPRIGKTAIVVKGSDPADLRKGPGLYDGTPFPGAPGTTAIAGHRTTYGAPFRHIDGMRRGDRIILELPYATFTYRVQKTRIVAPSDLAVIRRVGYDRLVLSACHPLFSAAKRIVVFARLARVTPGQTLVRLGEPAGAGTSTAPRHG